jgi:hypothetical protein
MSSPTQCHLTLKPVPQIPTAPSAAVAWITALQDLFRIPFLTILLSGYLHCHISASVVTKEYFESIIALSDKYFASSDSDSEAKETCHACKLMKEGRKEGKPGTLLLSYAASAYKSRVSTITW